MKGILLGLNDDYASLTRGIDVGRAYVKTYQYVHLRDMHTMTCNVDAGHQGGDCLSSTAVNACRSLN